MKEKTSSLKWIGIAFSILASLLLPSLTSHLALAGLVSFQKEYTYQASEYDSKVSCRALALEQVKRLLLEELGTYLESETEVKTFQLTKDHIIVLTAGIVRTEIIDEKWDGKIYQIKAKIIADPNEVIKSINYLRQNYKKAKELEEARKKADELLYEIEKLKKEMTAVKSELHEQKQNNYDNTIKDLSANDWYEKGLNIELGWREAIVSPSDEDRAFLLDREMKRIDAFTKAIELNPNDPRFYWSRGQAYDRLVMRYSGTGNKSMASVRGKQALYDYDRALELNSKFADVYLSRGDIYLEPAFFNFQKAIAEYTKYIELREKDAEGYCKRGSAFLSQNQYRNALKDFDTAIEVDPKYQGAYIQRGEIHLKFGNYAQAEKDLNRFIELEKSLKINAYMETARAYEEAEQFKEAIRDYSRAIEIDPKDTGWVGAYFYRARVYSKLGDYRQAIRDYDKAIQLHPNDTEGYYFRGAAYSKLGDTQQSIRDYKTAAKLGYKPAQDYLRSQGISW